MAAAGIACWLPALAAHPLQTEDTATQGAGNLELENGLERARSAGQTTVDYQLQASWGAGPTLDLIVQPAWASSRAAGEPRLDGVGDTNLDFKWRFFGRAPYSLALRSGVTLATARPGLGLPRGTVAAHATLVCTLDAEPFTVHGNLRLLRNPRAEGLRKEGGAVSAAVQWALSDSFTISAESAAASNDDPLRSAWQANWLVGAVWTLRPGLDLDIGAQSSVRSMPARRSWLLGLTWRFAP